MVMTVEQPRRQVKVAGGVGLVAVVLLCVGVVSRSGAPTQDNSALKEYYSQLDEIVVQPPREKCSKIGANCVSTKCCKISGYNCFEKKPGSASCMKSCIPGVNGTCLMPGSIVPLKPAVGVPGTTLFCFTFYMEDTGSTKKFYDLSLLRTNLFLGSSLFGCEAYKVYSDVETWASQHCEGQRRQRRLPFWEEEVDGYLDQQPDIHPGVEGDPHRRPLGIPRLDCEGRRRHRLPPHEAPYKIERPEGDLQWHLLGKLQVRELRLIREPRGCQPPGIQHFPRKP